MNPNKFESKVISKEGLEHIKAFAKFLKVQKHELAEGLDCFFDGERCPLFDSCVVHSESGCRQKIENFFDLLEMLLAEMLQGTKKNTKPVDCCSSSTCIKYKDCEECKKNNDL
jgi:hypothetical protein